MVALVLFKGQGEEVIRFLLLKGLGLLVEESVVFNERPVEWFKEGLDVEVGK